MEDQSHNHHTPIEEITNCPQTSSFKSFKTGLSISSTDSNLSSMESNGIRDTTDDPEIMDTYEDITVSSGISEKSRQFNTASPPPFEVEMFDYSQTGAKPKTKSVNNIIPSLLQTKSSLSSSTSSSLSSLSIISQNSYAPSTSSNLSSKKTSKINQQKSSSSIQNFDFNDDQSDVNEVLNFETFDSAKKVTNTALAPCPLCFKTVSTSLEAHFEQEHKEYECSCCGLLFDSDYILNQHILTMHPDKNPTGRNSPCDEITTDVIKDIVESEKLTCPVCMAVISEDVQELERHVNAHFTNTFPAQIDVPFLMAKEQLSGGSRANSASSLIANVDENFEVDQAITLSDFNLLEASGKNNDFSEQTGGDKCNDAASEDEFEGKSDLEIALILDKEEKMKSNSEYLTAQMLEFYRNESTMFGISNEENSVGFKEDLDYAAAFKSQQEADNEAAELEHEWLKQKFGMNNSKASSKAVSNLDKALKSHKIDLVTYHSEKTEIENRIKSVFDDGSTCTKGLIQIIERTQLNKFIQFRRLCSTCDYFSSGFIDSGYGCGYRNTQMLFSSIREDLTLKDVVFNNSNTRMPSITKIQSLIESAWSKGFDLEGRDQLGGSLSGSAKWIGATEVCAMFSSLRIKCELVDIQPAKGILIGPILFKFVRDYFEEETIKRSENIHPIYLQHNGHSRTIVGIEWENKCQNILLFDPSTRKSKCDDVKENIGKLMQVIRRNISSFNKYEAYQLVVIRGIISDDISYEGSKVLTSTRITS